MAPLYEFSDKEVKALEILKLGKRRYDLENNSKSLDGFEYIPSINLYVAKQRTHLGKNWFESHKQLKAHGERMLTLPEFVEFLRYAKNNLPETYKDITEVRSPWRAEWIDADFKVKNEKLYINSEVLDKNTLMEDKQISLEDYLNNNYTSQGLPSKKVKSGDLYYRYPRMDNSVARFGAYSGRVDLDCYWYPSNRISDLGVRAVRHE